MDYGSCHLPTSCARSLFISDDVEMRFSYFSPANRRPRSYVTTPLFVIKNTDSGFIQESSSQSRRRHFLDSCFLCKKRLHSNCDIFMYKGNIPFCSEECRSEQINADEAAEKQRKLSSSRIKKWVTHHKNEQYIKTDYKNVLHTAGTPVAR